MAISLVKLNNGTELLGDVKKTTSGLSITDPLQINYKFVSFQPMPTVSVSRYMPFAADPTFMFFLDQVVHVVEPKQTMIEYYTHALSNYQDEIDAHIDSELMGVVGRSSIKSSANKEELYTALLERLEVEGPAN
jgi:hypothetical protein